MPDVEVKISEPRHGAASTPEVNRSSSSEEVVHATEGGNSGGEWVDGTAILESLSPAALKKWRLTGILPADVDIKKKSERAIGENEAMLNAP